MKNVKTYLGSIVVVLVLGSLVISLRGIAVDVALDNRIKAIEGSKPMIANHPANVPVDNTSTVADTPQIASPTKSGVKATPTAGQTVYLNATGTKFHFWDGCTWFGYGSESVLETAIASGAKPCMLCEMHKVIKQK